MPRKPGPSAKRGSAHAHRDSHAAKPEVAVSVKAKPKASHAGGAKPGRTHATAIELEVAPSVAIKLEIAPASSGVAAVPTPEAASIAKAEAAPADAANLARKQYPHMQQWRKLLPPSRSDWRWHRKCL